MQYRLLAPVFSSPHVGQRPSAIITCCRDATLSENALAHLRQCCFVRLRAPQQTQPGCFGLAGRPMLVPEEIDGPQNCEGDHEYRCQYEEPAQTVATEPYHSTGMKLGLPLASCQ